MSLRLIPTLFAFLLVACTIPVAVPETVAPEPTATVMPATAEPAQEAPSEPAPCQLIQGEAGRAGEVNLHVEVIVDGLEIPWGLVILPSGDLLVTERPRPCAPDSGRRNRPRTGARDRRVDPASVGRPPDSGI